MLALCSIFSFVSYPWVLKGKVSSGRGESIPALPKMFLPCAVKVKVLACKGEWWWQPEGGSASVSHNSMVEWSMVHGGPSSSWEPTAPIIGAPRASMPASLLLHSIICHSESNWGLRGNRSLYNQGSRLLIERLFLVHLLVQSSSGESSRIVLKEIILWRFFPRHGWCHTRGWVDQPGCCYPLCSGNHNFSVTAPLLFLFKNSKI